ncbi:MAG: Galactose-1-phosphate uridylyltransferase [bacterium ADurb.Bin157]|jgi:UDPglucose--hexose-1-phosphate uridylyltransferase|nr:galactose-1-phosphate uridylyltransferase [Candidatus Riflebacteria bacterium]NLV94709.1 galactose-1-phosphate uridylyltransferase [Candidatus Riflebacteria bacterium]OQB49879.1 MAG: Galactose-1-phosphate uridylyltransferase [bacterium ADurb.Bin157]
MPQLRKDPILKQWVIISPERGKRPSDYKKTIEEPDDSAECPFCEGKEHLTPNETLSFRTAGTDANKKGWWVRIIPDSEPILRPEGEPGREGFGMFDAMNSIGVHEVVIESPNHNSRIHNATNDQVREIIWAYKQRLLEIKKNPSYKHFMVVKNSGAGLSNFTHSHSHIIATPIIPKRVEEEIEGAREYYHYHDRCLFCDIVKQEQKDQMRLVYENDQFIVFCPFASRFPFEMQIMPKSHQPFFEMIENNLVQTFADALQNTLKRQEAVLPGQPYNMVLHTSPCSDSYKDFYHWHVEIIPKLTKVAGFEWGSGFYINPTTPEDAAKALRDIAIK